VSLGSVYYIMTNHTRMDEAASEAEAATSERVPDPSQRQRNPSSEYSYATKRTLKLN